MRQQYETEQTLAAERQVVESVKHPDEQAVKLPKQYRIDFALVFDGSVKRFVEVKCRTNHSTQFDTYIISLAKVSAAKHLAQVTKLPVFLVVKWNDATGCVLLDQVESSHITFGGRYDRGDWQDEEPLVHIPISDFFMFEQGVSQS